MFGIIGQILYDDVSDLDAHWTSLADQLKALPFTRHVSFRAPNSKEGVLAMTLRDINEEYPVNLDALIALVERMEEVSNAGSSAALSEKKIAELRAKADDFEAQFGLFISRRLESFLRA